MKATPEPWKIQIRTHVYTEGIYELKDPYRHVEGPHLATEDMWAVMHDNRDLMEAAPGMFALLKRVRSYLAYIAGGRTVSMGGIDDTYAPQLSRARLDDLLADVDRQIAVATEGRDGG